MTLVVLDAECQGCGKGRAIGESFSVRYCDDCREDRWFSWPFRSAWKWDKEARNEERNKAVDTVQPVRRDATGAGERMHPVSHDRAREGCGFNEAAID